MSARRATLALLSAGAGLLAAGVAGGCSQEPTEAALRALQGSGPVSFLCLGAPDASPEAMAEPLPNCSANRIGTTNDYAQSHLYALVTQPTTGEVAVIDLSTDDNDYIVDDDPSVPGANFLSVGATPTAIVSTPGSMASFVAVAEPRFEGIYGLPSHMIRGGRTSLTSWPACRLPSAPGSMTIAVDPADAQGRVRPACDDAYGAAEGPQSECSDGEQTRAHCHGDLGVDAESAGQPGRYKLVVALPSEGGIAVIDAQSILDQDGGAFEPCTIERWLPLEVLLAPPAPPPAPPDPAPSCARDAPPTGATASGFMPQPAGMEHDGARLYIADRGAPVIHRVDLLTPCDPVEIPPLLPTSTEAPDRAVTTSRIAVSPLTLDLERYLYAIDDADGSIMVFDVSDASTETTPLRRPHPEANPFQPNDRIRFHAPPRDIIIVQHQNDVVDTITGTTLPVRCDPDATSSEPGTRYQTNATFDSGAGPTRLRGVFAFAVLSTGDIVTIDIDDYDAACRGPKAHHALFGCDASTGDTAAASGEYSCNVVAPHQARSAGYLVSEVGAGSQPGLVAFPSLFDSEGTLVQLDDEDFPNPPRMRATRPASPPTPFELVVGSNTFTLDTGTGLTEGDEEHTLAMNLEDPRAHILAQGWSVVYEGALPGFGARFAQLSKQADGTLRMVESSSRFCSRGVRSQNAVEEALIDSGMAAGDAAKLAVSRADYVQMLSSTPVEADPYWDTAACAYQQCQQDFGVRDQPRATRDLRILEAWDDQLVLETRGAAQFNDNRDKLDTMLCCFPGVVEFRIRGGNQWIVQGEQVGFLNHGAVRDDGVCRDACDPELALLNGRAFTSPSDDAIADDDPYTFRNPFFRFAILNGETLRDMAFSFQTKGSFNPQELSVVTNNPDVLPTSAAYLSNTGELVISDGILEGITLLDLNGLGVTRQYR